MRWRRELALQGADSADDRSREDSDRDGLDGRFRGAVRILLAGAARDKGSGGHAESNSDSEDRTVRRDSV